DAGKSGVVLTESRHGGPLPERARVLNTRRLFVRRGPPLQPPSVDPGFRSAALRPNPLHTNSPVPRRLHSGALTLVVARPPSCVSDRRRVHRSASRTPPGDRPRSRRRPGGHKARPYSRARSEIVNGALAGAATGGQSEER